MDHALPRGRRYGIRALLIISTILAILSIFAVWANRQVLDADNWSDTSSQMLQNDAIRAQLSEFLVETTYANVDVAAELESSLPDQLKPLASPLAGGLRQVALRTTNALLDRPRIQTAWEQANRLTAQQFIDIAEGKDSKLVLASGGAVVIDLRALVIELVQRLGLPGRAANALPKDAGVIKILDESQVSGLQDAVNIFSKLVIVLPVLTLLGFVAAVWLARGRRRETLMWVGIDLFFAGALVLILRRVLGDTVIEDLVKTDAARPAGEAAWAIGTDILRDVAGALVIASIPILLGAWVAGPSRPATATRRRLAPTMRDRVGVVYATAALVVLIVIAWGPIPATRKVIPVLIMIGLFALGIEALRRQTAEEFPAGAGEAEAPPAVSPPTAPA